MAGERKTSAGKKRVGNKSLGKKKLSEKGVGKKGASKKRPGEKGVTPPSEQSHSVVSGVSGVFFSRIFSHDRYLGVVGRSVMPLSW